LKNALISLHPTSHDLELNLQKLLLHYRITPHCSTNISPSELVFKKKIRSRLDLILPENTKPKFDLNSDKKYRKLDVGDLVQCRNFVGKVKWEKGHIIKCLGKLHYLIRLDDGREWKRHINQIQKIRSTY
jgi:hypothetical protein